MEKIILLLILSKGIIAKKRNIFKMPKSMIIPYKINLTLLCKFLYIIINKNIPDKNKIIILYLYNVLFIFIEDRKKPVKEYKIVLGIGEIEWFTG
jgi:hypothetical protein